MRKSKHLMVVAVIVFAVLATFPSAVQAQVWSVPSELDFGPVPIGTTEEASITVTNEDVVGGIFINDVEITENPWDFSIISYPTLPYWLDSGESVDIGVGFSPTDISIKVGMLSITTTGDPLVKYVQLFGLGEMPPTNQEIMVDPLTIDFGFKPVDYPRILNSTTITNVGTDPLTVSGIEVTEDGGGAFYAWYPELPFVLGPGEWWWVLVEFDDVDDYADPYVGTLEIVSNDPNTPVIEVSLLGVGSTASGAGIYETEPVRALEEGDFTVSIYPGATITEWTVFSEFNVASFMGILTDDDSVLIVDGVVADTSFLAQLILEVKVMSSPEELVVYEIVISVNESPTAEDDAYTMDEDDTLDVLAPGVLGNDADPDGDPLSASLVSGPSDGTLTFNPDGSFTYTPDPDWNGVDTFTYEAQDPYGLADDATVTITVVPVNDAPEANDDSATTYEDTVLIIDVLANDADVDGDPLTAVLVEDAVNGLVAPYDDGSFTYTPEINWNGVDVFTYKANDGSLDSNVATVTITVNPVNDAPVAVDDAYIINEDDTLNVLTLGVLGNDADLDGDPITAVLVSGPTDGSLFFNPDGSFTYTPEINWNGVDVFTYKANDGSLDSNVATVTITVNSVNDAPTTTKDAYQVDEDSTLNVPVPGVLANDADVEADLLTAVLVSGPSDGTLTLNPDGSFTYTPDADFYGVDTFTYQAYDPYGPGNTATVTITVEPVNDPPLIISTPPTAATVDVLYTYGVEAVDPDLDVLTYSLTTAPTGMTIDSATGLIQWTPTIAQVGENDVEVEVSDGMGGLAAQRFTVTVTEAPAPGVPEFALSAAIVTSLAAIIYLAIRKRIGKKPE